MDWDDPSSRAALLQRVGSDAYNSAFTAHLAAKAVTTANGHTIRATTTRFGRIYAVGDTGRGFSSLALADQYARATPPDAVHTPSAAPYLQP